MATSSATELWDVLVGDAAAESALWADAALPADEQERDAVFSAFGEPRFALGIETIYEGYLLHYGRPRLFAPPDADAALLLGDYLYAHGLVRVVETGCVEAVRDLAELISLCAQTRAEDVDGDWAVWAATAARLGSGGLDDARAGLRDERDAGRLEAIARASVDPHRLDDAVERHRRRSVSRPAD